MSVAELRLLIAEYGVEFQRKMIKRHPSVIHMGVSHDEKYNFFPHEYNYLEKRPRIVITYRERWHRPENKPREFTLRVRYVTTDGKGSSFFGHSSEYGHDVYISADDSFFASIVSIEKV